MKTYEITYSNGNDIYSANLVIAESAEQATAYYTAKGREVIGCTETMSRPKPGQPVVTVPEGWTAPAAETEQDTETTPAAEPETETAETTETAQDVAKESRIADIIRDIRASRAPYRTKYRTTAKAIRDAMRAGTPTVAMGYCELQRLLGCADPEAYTAGVYGWNFDVYRLGGLTICTGYRGMIGADVDTTVAEKAASACGRADLDARERMLAEWIYATLDALREGARA